VLGVLGSAALVLVTWLVAARPWEPAAAPPRPPSLEDWPELVRVRDLFQQGAMSPAAALAELDSASLSELPEEARFTKNGLVNEIKLALNEQVGALRAEFDGAIDESLLAHEFERARDLVGAAFSARLREVTGFDQVERLPQGVARFELGVWSRDVVARADAAQRSAFDRACNDIVTAYPATIGAYVADSLERRNWREPWEFLDRANNARWLEMVAATVDLRGLDERQRGAVSERILHLVNQDRTRVQRSVNEVLDELLGFIKSEQEQLFKSITDALEDDPGGRLREAFERKREGLGVVPERVPDDWMTKVTQPLELAVLDLEREAQTTLEETARAALTRLEARALTLRSQRRYEDEAELWAEYLLEPWRRVTHPTMRLRRRDAELLAGLLGHAAHSIDARNGQKLTSSTRASPSRRARSVAPSFASSVPARRGSTSSSRRGSGARPLVRPTRRQSPARCCSPAVTVGSVSPTRRSPSFKSCSSTRSNQAHVLVSNSISPRSCSSVTPSVHACCSMLRGSTSTRTAPRTSAHACSSCASNLLSRLTR
jgi:hypothetical protein